MIKFISPINLYFERVSWQYVWHGGFLKTFEVGGEEIQLFCLAL